MSDPWLQLTAAHFRHLRVIVATHPAKDVKAHDAKDAL